jgi:hypothetical protein
MITSREFGASVDTNHEVATALRLRSDRILHQWERLLRQQLPRVASQLESSQLRHQLPEIVSDLADLMECPLGGRYQALARKGPAQGIKRCGQRFELRDLLASQRLLRRSILEHVVSALRRPMEAAEITALNEAIDIVFGESTAAYFDCRQECVRGESESELKYLPFLSHDLNNNLNGGQLWLETLQQKIAGRPDFSDEVEMTEQLRQSISQIVHGMRQFLEHERLRSPVRRYRQTVPGGDQSCRDS